MEKDHFVWGGPIEKKLSTASKMIRFSSNSFTSRDFSYIFGNYCLILNVYNTISPKVANDNCCNIRA